MYKFQFYRFSISWSRVLPHGDISIVNEVGLEYYDNLIDELLAADIEPMVTIYHWDLPTALQDKGGFSNPKIVDYFEQYADLLFDRFANRVRTWITFNEPHVFCNDYYMRGPEPFYPVDIGLENYLCSHHVLMANAKMYDLYKAKYAKPGDRIGIAVNALYCMPEDENNATDVAAADRKIQFLVSRILFD